MPKQILSWKKVQAASRSDLVIRSGLPHWIKRVLRAGGVKKMSLLAMLTDEELLQVPGIGAKSITIIRTELTRMKNTEQEAPLKPPQPFINDPPPQAYRAEMRHG